MSRKLSFSTEAWARNADAFATASANREPSITKHLCELVSTRRLNSTGKICPNHRRTVRFSMKDRLTLVRFSGAVRYKPRDLRLANQRWWEGLSRVDKGLSNARFRRPGRTDMVEDREAYATMAAR